MTLNTKILSYVRSKIEELDKLEADSEILSEMENSTTENYIRKIINTSEIQKEIPPTEDVIQRYMEALITSKSSRSIILKRHPRDRRMNNYNPEWIFSWNANTDLQITLDFFEIISYITDYVGKIDDDTIVHLKEAKKQMLDLNMKEQLRKMADIFLTHRRVG